MSDALTQAKAAIENTQGIAATNSIEKIIANEIKVTPAQVWAAVKLLDSGATVPFIARYRKEATGGMTDDHLRMLSDRLEYLRDLEKRRIEITQSIDDQKKLTPELRAAIDKAQTKAQLEDIYLPYRPKKRSKAQAAKESGLEPLAKTLLENPSLDPMAQAASFVDPVKLVNDAISALAGAREILIEQFSESAALIGELRKRFWDEGYVVSSLAAAQKPEDSKFLDYFDFSEPIAKIPSHRMLAVLRGRSENVLKMSLEIASTKEDETYRKQVEDSYIETVCRHFLIIDKKRPADAWLKDTAKFAWKYKIKLHLEIDILMMLRKNAEEEAIKVFAQNLKNLLLAAPAGSRPTMGLDPGFRTGVKVAVVDATSKVVDTGAIFPHPPQEDLLSSARMLVGLIRKHKVELIAIGNGTASRETDAFVQRVLTANPDLKVNKVVVSEAGASVYSASEYASKELPTLDVSIRGAVSIARRLQDPLAELVKIDPKSIGVGQYQHDVNQSRLSQMLSNVVEDCVNAVGVDINTASPALLSYVSGLNKMTAARLVEFRQSKGAFATRDEVMAVPGMGPKVFEQAAGFLRIQNGANPLDASSVHPESYPVVEKILKNTGKAIKELMGDTVALKKIKASDYADERFGLPTVVDILNELEKPGRDPRPEFKTATFKEGVYEIKDLKPGMILEGTITNVANFGAFVDIGVHQDGLVHISEIANFYVSDPHQVVKTGQIVKVKVMDVDAARKRISLSMRDLSAGAPTAKTGGQKSSYQNSKQSGSFNSIFK